MVTGGDAYEVRGLVDGGWGWGNATSHHQCGMCMIAMGESTVCKRANTCDDQLGQLVNRSDG